MKLISSLNHPVRIPYGKDTLIIPPKGVVEVENPSLLGALPKGVFKFDQREAKKSKKQSK